MDILSEMSSVYYELTTSEKRIAEYIMDHTDEVQMMSIRELAEACHVGEATITRFCKRFHSRGYTALKIELVKLSHPSYEPFSDSQESETTTDSTVHQNIGGMLYGEYSAAMKQTAELLKKEQVIRAVEVLSQAEIVYCMGQGGSMLMAEEAAHLFSTVSSKFFSIYDSHLQISAAATMTAKAVLFFISYSGATTEMEDILSQAKQNGATIIMLTRFCKSPGAEKSDIVLQCGSNESPLQQGSVAAKIAQFYVLDILYHEYCSKNPEASARNKEKIMRALANRHQ